MLRKDFWTRFPAETDSAEMYDVETDMWQEAQKIVSIFQNEARMKRIALSLVIGESVKRLGINVIKTDPVRLGQVYVTLHFQDRY